ncbi:MAG: MATE family efflux transporter [Lachnospiraceae bacterium]|nr:MATE family efflux transporter [Lachnospiraceae bacterium]
MSKTASDNNRLFSNSDLRKLILPLMVEQFLAMLVGMIDTIMVSSVGEEAISGVSLVNEVNFLMITILAALATGGTVVVSQYLGAGNKKTANLAASQLFIAAAVFGLVLMGISEAGKTAILAFLYRSLEPEVMSAAVIYLGITALSFPFLAIYNSTAALYRAMSKTRTTMWVSILMNTINVVGNYFGVYVFNMGVAGVAWPTLISRAVAGVLMTALAFNHKNEISIVLKDIFSWRPRIMKKILRIALPNGIENGLFQLGRVLVSSIVATYATYQIAANGVMHSFSTMGCLCSVSVNLATIPVIGKCVGADDYVQARYYIKKLVLLNMVLSLATTLLLLVLTPVLLPLFTITPEAAEVVKTLIKIQCITIPLMHALSFTLPNALRAAGDVNYTMIVGVSSMFLARIAGSYLLGTVMGLYVVGIFLAMYLDWVVRIICFVIRYKSGKWTKYRLIDR